MRVLPLQASNFRHVQSLAFCAAESLSETTSELDWTWNCGHKLYDASLYYGCDNLRMAMELHVSHHTLWHTTFHNDLKSSMPVWLTTLCSHAQVDSLFMRVHVMWNVRSGYCRVLTSEALRSFPPCDAKVQNSIFEKSFKPSLNKSSVTYQCFARFQQTETLQLSWNWIMVFESGGIWSSVDYSTMCTVVACDRKQGLWGKADIQAKHHRRGSVQSSIPEA